jgi:hypothetical protein
MPSDEEILNGSTVITQIKVLLYSQSEPTFPSTASLLSIANTASFYITRNTQMLLGSCTVQQRLP